MLTSHVPRTEGLDQVVHVILGSKTPFLDLGKKLGHLFFESWIIPHAPDNMEMTSEQYVDRWEKSKDGGRLDDLLEVLQQGGEIGEGRRNLFWFGNIGFIMAIPSRNGYNPSFEIVIWPEETVGIKEHIGLGDRYNKSHIPIEYTHLKTLLLSYSDGGSPDHYLVIVDGNSKVHYRSVGQALGLSSKKSKKLKMAEINPVEVIGREEGCVGPLIYKECFGNVKGVLLSEGVLKGYSKPHYVVPIDKQTSIALADVGDLVDILKKVVNYPQIIPFINLQSEGRQTVHVQPSSAAPLTPYT